MTRRPSPRSLDRAASLGSPALVVDQAGSLAQLVITVAARRGVPVAYVPGLVAPRPPTSTRVRPRPTAATPACSPTSAAPGAASSTGSIPAATNCSGSCASWAADADLAADATRLSNRLRDAHHQCFPGPGARAGPQAPPRRRTRPACPPEAGGAGEAGRGRIGRTIRKRSPRLAAALTNAVLDGRGSPDRRRARRSRGGRVIAELGARAGSASQERASPAPPARAAIRVARSLCSGRILGSLPGVGPRTGSTILAEGDGSRFANGSRLASYAGLAPAPASPAPASAASRGAAAATTAQERHVPRRLRIVARPCLEGLLRPQARRGKAPQRRQRICLARAPLRRHPRDAALPHVRIRRRSRTTSRMPPSSPGQLQAPEGIEARHRLHYRTSRAVRSDQEEHRTRRRPPRRP